MAVLARTPAVREPDFVGMIERHRESQTFWGRCSVILFLFGLVVAGYGLTAAVGWHSGLFWLGLFFAALSVVPLLEMLERRDRASGLNHLRDEWRSIERAPDTEAADLDRLDEIIRKTHG